MGDTGGGLEIDGRGREGCIHGDEPSQLWGARILDESAHAHEWVGWQGLGKSTYGGIRVITRPAFVPARGFPSHTAGGNSGISA
jgi:hypothetical protein